MTMYVVFPQKLALFIDVHADIRYPTIPGYRNTNHYDATLLMFSGDTDFMSLHLSPVPMITEEGDHLLITPHP